MLGDLAEEALESQFPLKNLLTLIVVPIPKSILGRYGRNYAGGIFEPECLVQPLKVAVPPIHLYDRIMPDPLSRILLHFRLHLIEAVLSNPTQLRLISCLLTRLLWTIWAR
jgi:hypothetical protein